MSRCENPDRDPNAISATWDFGLFQVNGIHAWRAGGDPYALLDPQTNVDVAYELYAEYGSWHHWRFSASCHGLR